MRYRCMSCDLIYDETVGDPDNGVAPGTSFESLPTDWTCKDRGRERENFTPE